MRDSLTFCNRAEFRNWLEKNGRSSEGVWLLFGKKGGPATLKASEALEEALCFGWIDGQMQSIDEETYLKYFSSRRKNSKWSEKNKALVENLERQELMTLDGREKIEEAKRNGQWDAPKAAPITNREIAMVLEALKAYEPACTNFKAMSPSVKKTYAKAYFDAKTDDARTKRLSWMVERLNQNLKPM